MDLNEIKIGAKLACDAKIAEIDGDVVYIEFSAHKKFRLAAELVELLDAQNAATAPKYDPCRELRAGDKVKLKTNFGRNPYDTFDGSEYIPDDTVFTVLRDEWAGGKVDIYEKDESDAFTVHFTNLELVTPVEELEPYFIEETEYEYCVSIMVGERKDTPATYHKRMHPHAIAAAEAECARLNAEYRKEQK